MSRVRSFLTQRYVWPAFLAVVLGVLVAELAGVAFGWWGWLPSQLHSTIIGATVIGAAMTAFSRQIGPVQEAYRLGMIAGARQERTRQTLDERRQTGRSPIAVGAEGDTGDLAAFRPPLTLIRRNG